MKYKVEHINQKGGFFKDAYDKLEKSMQAQLDYGSKNGWRLVNTHILTGLTMVSDYNPLPDNNQFRSPAFSCGDKSADHAYCFPPKQHGIQ